jgi:hypothetical protein
MQLDQELLDQQAAIYRVEGVDESAPAAQHKKKRKANNDEVRHNREDRDLR